MINIKNIVSREIIDSRGIPTIETDIILSNDVIARAAIPSGASTGSYEAIELRDGDAKRFKGKGVLKAIYNVENIIFPAIKNMNAFDQSLIDQTMIELDGTNNKSKLGANAILSVSIALAKAIAKSNNLPIYKNMNTFSNTIPMPLVNVINGGAHADNNIDIQEFMIVPVGASNFSDAIRMCCEVFQSLKSVLNKKSLNTGIGDEGGFAPNLRSTKEAFDVLMESIESSGYVPWKDFNFAIDVAANEIYEDGFYKIEGKKITACELIDFYKELVESYPIISIEDGLSEDDWDNWKLLNDSIGKKVQLIGDDLFVTNKERLLNGIKNNSANSILIKLNQIGTITETVEVIEIAKQSGWSTVISHRSGETEDSFIADFAVAMSASQIKSGSVSRSERLAKYNQLIRIEEELGKDAKFSSFGK